MKAVEQGVLVLEDVVRTHGTGEGRVHALQGISLAVRPGELVAVMGELDGQLVPGTGLPAYRGREPRSHLTAAGRGDLVVLLS